MKKTKAIKVKKSKNPELNWQMYLALTIVVLLATPIMMVLHNNSDPITQTHAAGPLPPIATVTPIPVQP